MNVQTNQVRHIYVAKKSVNNDVANVGDLRVRNTTDGSKVWLEYMGPDGVITSDYIIPGNGVRLKTINGKSMDRALKSATIHLNKNIKDSNGNVIPVAGQNYVIRVAISQYIDISDESIYTKYGVVAATNGMTASEFYVTLALSLAKNFSREVTKFFDFYLTYTDSDTAKGASEYKVSAKDKKDAILALKDSKSAAITFTGVKIVEVEQDYVRGLVSKIPVYFNVYADEINYNNNEVPAIEEVTLQDTTTVVGNGYGIADIEYFALGERGDRFRMMGYPNYIPTTYLVDETKTYDCIELHHKYLGKGVDYKTSEKDILIVVPTTATSATTADAETTKIVSALNAVGIQ